MNQQGRLADLEVEALLSHADTLLRYARPRVADAATAEDLVQETLLTALGAQERFRGASGLGTWLIGILRNKLLDHHRWRARHPSAPAANAAEEAAGDVAWFTTEGDWRVDPNTGLEGLADDAAHALERAQLREAIAHCVERLSASLHRVFVLCELEDLPPEQICEIVGLTRGSLAVMLHRARHSLRACLQASWRQA